MHRKWESLEKERLFGISLQVFTKHHCSSYPGFKKAAAQAMNGNDLTLGKKWHHLLAGMTETSASAKYLILSLAGLQALWFRMKYYCMHCHELQNRHLYSPYKESYCFWQSTAYSCVIIMTLPFLLIE